MKTKVGNDIKKVVNLLKSGELVAIPTETVYGLAAIFSNEDAVKKIFEVKKRPASNPLILHVDSIEQIHLYVEEFPRIFQELATKFCPGPLTFLMKKSAIVSELITAGNNRVAIRIPDNVNTLSIIKALGFPVVAPSANLYGKLSPTRAQHVVDQLDGKISYVFDGGECERGIESTIIGIEGNEVVIYRLGSITPEDLGQHLGYLPGLKVHEDNIPVASGMVKYHYAPSTP
ncbi:MAG TPA: threonylcarbamoyl-AMP synthase, partial [Crocinitomicaceae bacterium]|nr:threonylcarbamoyl-AMP synthase [Crocinitomicaceae bacterium]